jgi:hypothetical protein
MTVERESEMKRTITIAAAVIVLGACAGSDPKAELRADCMVIAEDEEGQKNIAGMGGDTASFCDCMLARIEMLDEATQAKVALTLDTVATRATETGRPVEDIAIELMRPAMVNPDDKTARDLMDGVGLVGRMIDEVEEDFGSGACTKGAA